MSALGPTGSNSHTHPGLTFPQYNGLRRQYPPTHSSTPPKSSPTPQQHQSPYQPQQYTPQQPPHATYPHALFSNTTPSPVPSVPNGSSRHNSAQAHVASAVAAARQRGGPQRPMQQQPAPPLYLQQTMNQPVPQQVPQQVPQPVQQLQQPSPIPQPVQSVSQPPPAVTQAQQVQQVQQTQQLPNDSNLMSQTTPQHQTQHQAHPQPHAQPHAQVHPQQQPLHSQSQPLHSQPSALPPQPNSQPQTQAPPPPQHDTAVPTEESHHDEDMELDSQADSADGSSSLEPKLLEGTPFVPRAPMGSMMSPPPEGGSFATLDAVHKHVIAYCTSVGYAVVIGRSKKTVPGLKKVLFVCDRAGKPPSRVSPEQRKRKTTSRKCNCQFGFFAIEQRTQWTIRYRPDQAHLKHNHGPSESPLLHPAARKLDSKMVAAVKQLKESGIGVSQTLEILQNQHPHVPLLPRDIYNARAAINRNPQKVEAGIAEARPAIYSKPAPTAEERIRSDLRRELAKAREELRSLKESSKKEVEELKNKLREKDKQIEKFEMFIDICNQRVMMQRERLADTGENNSGIPSLNS